MNRVAAVMLALSGALVSTCAGREADREEVPRVALPAPRCPAALAAAVDAEAPTPVPCRTPTASCLGCHP